MRALQTLAFAAPLVLLSGCGESAAEHAAHSAEGEHGDEEASEASLRGAPILGDDFEPPAYEGPSLEELEGMELSAEDIVERSFDTERVAALEARHAENQGATPEFVGWDVLAGFEYQLPEIEVLNEIEDTGELGDLEERFPLEVVELEGRYVELEGYMVPYEYDEEGIVSFTLVRDQAMCCYGGAFRTNHFVEVVMANDGRAEPADLDPIAVTGTLQIGEVAESGYVLSLYRMLADEVELSD